jgi:deazaflavin-dependent oxidoreductase (nitroreductase family)
LNPLVRPIAMSGLAPGYAVLETTGRKSGQPRRTPVGNGLSDDGGTFWLVTEFGHSAQYVRNIRAQPRVRVRIRRRWRTGTATILPDDDTRARQRSMPSLNAAVVRAVGTEQLTIRIDLDP